MEELHPRMPLMLPESLWADWLTADEEEAPHLLEAVTALGPRADGHPDLGPGQQRQERRSGAARADDGGLTRTAVAAAGL
jgi:hypothetical protein